MHLAVLSAGAPRHGRAITKQWQSIADQNGWGWELEFWEWENGQGYDNRDFASVQWAVWIGLFERAFDFMLMQSECKHLGVFVGTDLLQHLDLVQRGYPDPFHAATILAADAPHLVQEAQRLTGREVGYVRSIPPETYQARPIERWDNILAYVPTGREDFFRWPWILEVARDYPDIAFNILARQETQKEQTNVVAIPEIQGEEKRQLFERCFTYLRPIEHDGIGLTLIEAAQLGRFIFHSDTRIPHVLPARSVGEMEFHLDEILRRKRPPSPEINSYYVRQFSEQRLADDVEQLRRRMEDV